MLNNILILDTNKELKRIIERNSNIEPINLDSRKELQNFREEEVEMIFFNVNYDFKVLYPFNSISKILIIPNEQSTINLNYAKMQNIDFISYPFNKEEVLARLRIHSTLASIKENNIDMERFTDTLVSTLINISLKNDIETGEHIKRVKLFSEALAEEYGCDDELIEEISTYAPLHDIGKIGIPDKILKKPAEYTPQEFEKMKYHTQIGKEIIDNTNLKQTAKDIVQYHHEKWNGGGYLNQLEKDEIPISARIVALADVYDALTQTRVYKSAFTQEKTNKIIKEDKGEHFDPNLVDLYFDIEDRFIEIRKNHQTIDHDVGLIINA